jgi:hypothetical protein
MKKFEDFSFSIRENKKMNISGISVEIQKANKGYKVIIDDDVLDTYSSEQEALKMAKEFVKQYKGK